ncbi:FIST N-terminal domain-containing protein [Methanocaldococcus infernus]
MESYRFCGIINNPYADGIRIGSEIKNKLSGSSLILVFSNIDEEKTKEFLSGLGKHVPLDNVMGCSVRGTFFSNNKYYSDSILIYAFPPHLKSAITFGNSGEELNENIREELIRKYSTISEAGYKYLGIMLLDWDEDPNVGCKILNDFCKASSIPTIGGVASDDFSFNKTFLIYKGEILKNTCVLGVVGGKFRFDLFQIHGYEATNIYMKVTRSEKNIIYELDGKPAYERYVEGIAEYLGLSKSYVEENLCIGFSTLDEDKLFLSIFHPVGYISLDGKIAPLYIIESDGKYLKITREVNEGIYLSLLSFNLSLFLRKLKDKLEYYTMNFKSPSILLFECAGINFIKEKLLNSQVPYFRRYSPTTLDFEKYKNVYGWLTYGELLSKDLVRCFTHLTLSGLVVENSSIEFNIIEGLKAFEFNELEIKIILLLLGSPLFLEDIAKKLNISKYEAELILNKLINKGIVSKIGEKYRIENLKESLEKIDQELDLKYVENKLKRYLLLKLL